MRTTLSGGIANEDQPSLGQIGSSLSLDIGSQNAFDMATRGCMLRTLIVKNRVMCDALPDVNIGYVRATLPSDDTDKGVDGYSRTQAGRTEVDGQVAGFTSSPVLDTFGNQVLIGATDGTFYCLNTRVNAVRTTVGPIRRLPRLYPPALSDIRHLPLQTIWTAFAGLGPAAVTVMSTHSISQIPNRDNRIGGCGSICNP